MNQRVQQSITSFTTNPPRGSKATAYRLMGLWEAYPNSKRDKLKKKHGNYPVFPELEWVTATMSCTYSVLVNAEQRKRIDCTPCWAALDRGLRLHAVKKVLAEAKAKRRKDPTCDIQGFLISRLAQEKLKQNEGSKFAKPSRKPAPPKAAPASTAGVNSESDEWTIALSRVAVQAAMMNLPALEYVHRFMQAVTMLGSSPPPQPEPTKATEVRSVRSTKPATVGRPHINNRIRKVMGRDELTVGQVIERLKEHDANAPPNEAWLPQTSDIDTYIRLVLSSHTGVFRVVRPGVYRARHAHTAPPPPPFVAADENVPGVEDVTIESTTKSDVHSVKNGLNGSALENPFEGILDSPFSGGVFA